MHLVREAGSLRTLVRCSIYYTRTVQLHYCISKHDSRDGKKARGMGPEFADLRKYQEINNKRVVKIG